jgi:ABC-type transport system involved in cytochrome c biogenesis permease subunit
MPLPARSAEELDLSAWRQLPVFDRGRIMPLDTFARDAVGKICGRVGPRLRPPADQADDPQTALARELFPDGKERKFSAAELLLSWIVEPEKWEQVPFLVAGHHALREDLMHLPQHDSQGNRLKYVSPHQVMLSAERQDGFIQTLREIERKERETQGSFVPVGVDRKAKELENAFGLFRLLSFNPTTGAGDRGQRVQNTLMRSFQLWQELAGLLEQVQQTRPNEQLPSRIKDVSEAAKGVARIADREDIKLSEFEPLLTAYGKAAAALADTCNSTARQLFAKPMADSGSQSLRRAWNEAASKSSQLARLCNEVRLALYDNGQSLRVIPALNPAALQSTRDSGDDAQPWLDLRLVVNGSSDLLRDYPQQGLQAVREALAEVKTAYTDRTRADRPQRFGQAMDRFVAAVRTLGERTDKLRQEMTIADRDDATMRATAYPPPGSTRAEVEYNLLDPFFWSWVISFVALACFGLSFGIMRVPMFWLGVVVLLAGQAFTLYGFGLRAYITGWVPVAGMFETIIFVSLTAALMGLWLTLSPLLTSGVMLAWQPTAMPGTWESRGLQGKTPAAIRYALLAIRVGLMVLVFHRLALQPFGTDGDARMYFNLLPKTDVGSILPSINNVIAWAVGLCVLLPLVWYVPRALVAVVLLPVTIPLSLARMNRSRAWDQVRQRKLFALVGAFLAFFVAYITDWMPLEQKGLGQMAAVLRDNFWLTIHVLTITASYAAGAIAWGLGNIALGYYLFGRYRDSRAVSMDAHPNSSHQIHRPAPGHEIPLDAHARLSPEACIALGGFIYKAIQVAVLLLAAGTIFGALWADVAWGRFWSWDAKEVWALVSLLVYMAILHGRYAGWFGNFGLACGAVAGATAIIMAWYGANYWFPSGRHAYASGEGGQLAVGISLGLNWLFLLIVAVWHTSAVRAAPHETSTSPAEKAATR